MFSFFGTCSEVFNHYISQNMKFKNKKQKTRGFYVCDGDIVGKYYKMVFVDTGMKL